MAADLKMGGVWWGRFSIPEGNGGKWRIGPMDLWVQRFAQEWRVTHQSTGDAMEGALAVTVPAGEAPEAENPSVHRFSLRKTSEALVLSPELPDRPVVIQPEMPIGIPAGEEVTLYVSLPLWLRLEVDDPPRLLLEIPIFRPSDTWFGPSTLSGEICYASRTQGRLRLADVPFRPHRAVTPLLIRNLSRDLMALKRLNLPVAYLSLLADAKGGLWTQPVTMEREENGLEAGLLIGSGPPGEAGDAVQVCGPRQIPEKGLIRRAFGALFN